MSFLNDPKLDTLLDELYQRSARDEEAMASYFAQRAKEGSISWTTLDARTEKFLSDKMVALERDKAEFCYALCRALKAKRIVEAGTSFGVSTLFLAAALRDTVAAEGGSGIVIGTEHEPEKAKAARANFARAGLGQLIDLREGDLGETLKGLDGPIDFMLVDIWIGAALTALARIAPLLREGAIVITDNTTQFKAQYKDYFAFLADPRNGLRTMTLPFKGGLEMSVKLRAS
jgi:predicted O-methyltransferase YrrM